MVAFKSKCVEDAQRADLKKVGFFKHIKIEKFYFILEDFF